MSLPCSQATCSLCGTTFAPDDLYGNRVYEIGQTRLHVDSLAGWCYECNAHRSIESLRTEPLEEKLREMEGERSAKPGFFESISSEYKKKRVDLEYQLQALQKLLSHFKIRKTGPRCLSCGSLNVEPCTNKGNTCYRPGCAGHLVEDSHEPLWISYADDTMLYDMDGNLLRAEQW